MNYSALDGRLFCKPHFLEMFRTKGTQHSNCMFVYLCVILETLQDTT